MYKLKNIKFVYYLINFLGCLFVKNTQDIFTDSSQYMYVCNKWQMYLWGRRDVTSFNLEPVLRA